ncbi:MAG: Cys-tRNA(Pro) deacylase [Bacteroidetes bacterium]|nr:Cys-tRNA(Pro) deacylase [bacterium]NBP63471.1 Cys-tRNA(Pro) deacylase [Bacteroidota bacterium]
MSSIKKTNCCRILDSLNITYELLVYDWSEESLDAISVADKLCLPHDQVFKTLVLRGDVTPIFVIIVPGNVEVSLKKVAKSTGNTACSLLPIADLFSLTGYLRGGCSPIGMKKQFPTFLEETSFLFDVISISPGQRGMQILIAPKDIITATQAIVSNLL